MFPITRFRIEDRSMEPTLSPGDFVLVNRWTSKFAKGDLIAFSDPENAARVLVKRIMDVANGGSFFVVGDNVTESRDSRAFGSVPRNLVIGRVLRRVQP